MGKKSHIIEGLTKTTASMSMPAQIKTLGILLGMGQTERYTSLKWTRKRMKITDFFLT